VSRQRLDPDALPIVLRQRISRKLFALLMTLWAGVFPFAGIALIAVGVDETAPGTALAGAALLVVSGLVWLYWALQLVPGSCRLRVTTGAFSMRHCFITREHGWDDVGSFYVRTYSTPRVNDYETVAFTGEESRVIGLASFLDELRFRGVAASDILPDTYGYPAGELAEFLNACSERYGQRSPDHVPRTIPVTRGYLIGVSLLLVAFVAGFLIWAAASAADGDRWGVVIGLAFASPFAYALVNGWILWRRGKLRRGARFRGPGDTAS
jgi:hypothetical protein